MRSRARLEIERFDYIITKNWGCGEMKILNGDFFQTSVQRSKNTVAVDVHDRETNIHQDATRAGKSRISHTS